jgi:MYXO-CTERM domain-containing protein
MTSAQGLSASGSVAVAGFDSFKFYVSGAGGEGGNLYANSFLVTAVPAPGAIALLGVAGLVGARRRR